MKQKKKEYNLKHSILLLLLLAVFLIVASYAWFTSNQVVTVSSLDVQVEAKNGLQISVDGTNWKSVIASSDITGAYQTYPTNAGNTNQLPSILEPVSTVGNIDATTGFMKMYYGEVVTDEATGDYYLTATRSTEVAGTTGRFIAFDLFFKVDQDTEVFLSRNSNVISTTGFQSVGMEYASRVAFANEGNVAAGTATSTIQGLKGAIDSLVYIWEPNSDVHTAAAVAHANDTYGITSLQQSGASALANYGIKAPIARTDNVLVGNTNLVNNEFFSLRAPNYTTAKAYNTATENVSLFELKAGITKMRMYMWVEGQDVDCENNASGSNISFNLQVTTKQV